MVKADGLNGSEVGTVEARMFSIFSRFQNPGMRDGLGPWIDIEAGSRLCAISPSKDVGGISSVS